MKTERPTLIYIVGMGHSGSTLLELLLNQFENVAAMGEISLFSLQLYRDERTRWVGLCSCGARPDACPIWGTLIDNIHRAHGIDASAKPFGWMVSDVGVEEEYGWKTPWALLKYKFSRYLRYLGYVYWRPLLYLSESSIRKRIKQRDLLVTEYADIVDKPVVVDASKGPIEMLDIATHSQLPLKVVFLTRNPCGLAWSALRSNNQSVAKTARAWSTLNRRILKLLEKLDSNDWTHVEYEALCRDPGTLPSEILSSLGIEGGRRTDTQSEFVSRHTIAGNKHRFSPLMEVREDDAWRSRLARFHVDTIRRITGPLVSRLSSRPAVQSQRGDAVDGNPSQISRSSTHW